MTAFCWNWSRVTAATMMIPRIMSCTGFLRPNCVQPLVMTDMLSAPVSVPMTKAVRSCRVDSWKECDRGHYGFHEARRSREQTDFGLLRPESQLFQRQH